MDQKPYSKSTESKSIKVIWELKSRSKNGKEMAMKTKNGKLIRSISPLWIDLASLKIAQMITPSLDCCN